MVSGTRNSTSSHKRLQFREKILAKGQNTDVLLRKLKALYNELALMDQEDIDVKSLGAVSKDLINTSILMHKDKGVRAYASCCLGDLFRLYAPDAPYTELELRNIFQFFFSQLVIGLKNSNSPYYTEYYHLIESLATVKSVVLICDLPQADELMTEVFRDFFGLIRFDLAKNVEIHMLDILSTLIDECQTLPNGVLDLIMAQFMDKHTRMDQPAYRLSVGVCNNNSDKLQRHVNMYITDLIVQHSQDENFDEVRSAHELIKKMNQSCPSLLHNVVPQLEEELRVEEVQIRQMATQVLGEMFADKGGSVLEKKHNSTWTMWLARMNDKSAVVRLAFVEACKGILQQSRLDMRETIESALAGKLCDPDDKIRAAVCKLYSQLDYETVLHRVSGSQLRAIGERCLDKKHNVRQEALTTLGKLYSLAFTEIENGDQSVVQHFGWIPQQLLRSIPSTEAKAAVESVIADYILPLPNKSDDLSAWTDRLLLIMCFLDDKSVSVLLNLSRLRHSLPNVFEIYLQSCEDNNGGIIDEDEENVKRMLLASIKFLSYQFPDPQKASDDLQKFAALNERRLYKLLRTCMDSQTDVKSLLKASNEFHRRIDESSPSISGTMSSFIRKASFWIVNQSSIPCLVRRIQKGDLSSTIKATDPGQQIPLLARRVLKVVCKECPGLLRPHVTEFLKALAEEPNPAFTEVCLHALSAAAQSDKALAPSDKRSIERIMLHAKSNNPRHAKFATRIIASTARSEEFCADLIEFISDDPELQNEESLVAHIAVLAELVRIAPDAFESKSDIVVPFLVTKVLMAPPQMSTDEKEDEVQWGDDDGVPLLAKAKIASLKVLCRRCLAHSDAETAVHIAKPVLNMLFTVVDNGGSIRDNQPEEVKVQSRLRLQAATSLLKLATVEKLSDAVTRNFIPLALTVQDPSFEVRLRFLTKLLDLLRERKLDPRFNTILFLTVHDPEVELKEMAQAFVVYVYLRWPSEFRLLHFEKTFVFLLHLLAHHPDFSMSEDGLKHMSKCTNFYLDLIATSENISFLYHLAMKLKSVRDAESHTYSENLYAMSELAQQLIKKRAKANNWSITSFPVNAKFKLPADIFRALPSSESANKIHRTAYLPEGALQSVEDAEKAETKRARRLQKMAGAKRSNGDGLGRPRGRKPTAKRRRVSDSDEEEEEGSEASAVEDEDDRSLKGNKGNRNSESMTSELSSEPLDILEDEAGEDEEAGPVSRTRAKTRAKAKRDARRKSSS